MNDFSHRDFSPDITRLKQILGDIYPSPADEVIDQLVAIIREARQRTASRSPREGLWDQQDCVLITYADQVRQPESGSPLAALHDFIRDYGLQDCFNCIHLLPFCPWTSDDGFSVVDYMEVAAENGSWQDIAELGQTTDLMFDLVLNHCSQQHDWFRRFLLDQSPYDRYFLEVDPNADLSAVVRPRSLPLLTPFETASGTKHVWTTFSPDQVDLNYAEPSLLIEMARTFVEYALRGARIIRLDAIAFLWKVVGRKCIHEPETHAIVRLLRCVIDQAVPGTLVLTETNVPHPENISYFGDGDEAHMVYQFSLPPLLLDAIESGDTQVLSSWLRTLEPPHADTTFFNFTASHDGIGVRPLEGLVSQERFAAVVERVRRHGGVVSTRTNASGGDSPYELNITYLDAVADPALPANERVRRFLATQGIMLAMQGIPAVYFQSLVGAPSDRAGMLASGHNRTINRHKYDRHELDQQVADAEGVSRMVFDCFRHLLRVRRQQPAFHPNATQRVLALPSPGVLGFVRGEGNPSCGPITVLGNLSEQSYQITTENLPAYDCELITGRPLSAAKTLTIEPFELLWLGTSTS